MAQDWKPIVLIFLLFWLGLKYFTENPRPHKLFHIDRHRITYHSNWTGSYSRLPRSLEFVRSQSLTTIQELDVSLAMSSLKREDILRLFPHSLLPYKKIRFNLANINLGTLGADQLLSKIDSRVVELELGLDSIGVDTSFGEILARHLNRFTVLRSLKISLIMTFKDNDKAIADLLRVFKLPAHLESYSLSVIGNRMTADAIVDLEAHLKPVSLRDLQLNFYANKLEVNGSQLVSNAVRTQKNLKRLNLDLYFNNITETGTELICAAVGEVVNSELKYINLNFDFNYIKNEGGKAIGKLIATLTGVESLHIGVASKNFGFLGYKYVVQSLEKLTQLKELTLRCGINRVGYNGAVLTRDVLSKLVNLESINIDYLENYVGDHGIVVLTEFLASLPKLKNVRLNLGFNDAKGFGVVRVVENLVKYQFDHLFLGLSNNQFRDHDVNLIKGKFGKLIKNNRLFEMEFMETAIGKKMKKSIEDVFNRVSSQEGKKTLLLINSIISEEDEERFREQQMDRSQSQQSQLAASSTESTASDSQATTNSQMKDNELNIKEEAQRKKNQEAALKAKQENDAQIKREAELKVKQEAELKAKQEAQLKAKQEAELKVKQEAELKAKQEAELKAKQEVELKTKQEAELKAKQEAQLKAKQEAELKAKQEAELKAKQEAQLKAKQEAELKAKQEAELKAKQESELKAKQEAQILAKKAEFRAKHAEEQKLKQAKIQAKEKCETNESINSCD